MIFTWKGATFIASLICLALAALSAFAGNLSYPATPAPANPWFTRFGGFFFVLGVLLWEISDHINV